MLPNFNFFIGAAVLELAVWLFLCTSRLVEFLPASVNPLITGLEFSFSQSWSELTTIDKVNEFKLCGVVVASILLDWWLRLPALFL